MNRPAASSHSSSGQTQAASGHRQRREAVTITSICQTPVTGTGPRPAPHGLLVILEKHQDVRALSNYTQHSHEVRLNEKK